MLIIAERINASRKTIAQAMAAANRTFIQEEAKTSRPSPGRITLMSTPVHL